MLMVLFLQTLKLFSGNTNTFLKLEQREVKSWTKFILLRSAVTCSHLNSRKLLDK